MGLRLWVGAAALGAVVLGVAAWWLIPAWHRARVEARVEHFWPRIQAHAQASGLPPKLVRAVVVTESGGNPRALSSANARGLMQMTDAAEQDVLKKHGYARGDLYDPEYNLKVGTGYLAMLAQRFDGDLYLAVGAYHMGPGRLNKLRRAHPELGSHALIDRHANPTSRAYCRLVFKRFERYQERAGAP